MDKSKTGYRLYGLLKMVPALWIFSIIVTFSQHFSFARYVSLEVWFSSVAFWLSGLVFIADALMIWPKKAHVNPAPSIFLLIIGGISTVIGLLIFNGFFRINTITDEFATLLLGLLAAGLILTVITGVYEMVSGKHGLKQTVKVR